MVMDVVAGSEDTVRLLADSEGMYHVLQYPDGEEEYVNGYVGDTYAAAWHRREGPAYVFEDGELITELDYKVWNALPLERGYVVLDHGVHQDIILSIYSLEHEEMILQRKVSVVRGLEASPDERYVATWRLTDGTVYIYDVVEAAESGRFCVYGTGAENVNLYGTIRDGEQVFEIEDNPSNTTVGYVTTDGEYTAITEIDRSSDLDP